MNRDNNKTRKVRIKEDSLTTKAKSCHSQHYWFGRNSNNKASSKLKPYLTLSILALLLFGSLIYLISQDNIKLASQDQQGQVAGAAWHSTDWNFRKKITIDHTKVDDDLTDFPVLINQDSDEELKEWAQDNGEDILFTSDDGLTKLSHQIENYDNTDGSLRAWVKTNLSSTTNTELYIYYGNQQASDQQNITDVWSNNYAGVWLMNEGEGTTVHDYSGNDNHGTMVNMDPSSWVEHDNGYALEFDGGNDYVKIVNNFIDNPDYLTIYSKFKKIDNGDNYECVLHKSSNSTIGSSDYWLGLDSDDYLTATIGANTSVGWAAGKTSEKAVQDTWYYLLASWDGGVVNVYIDGEYKTGYNLTSYGNLTTPTRFGSSSDGSNYQFSGQVDKIRISSTARSASWISTEYNNQDSPSTFYTLDGAVGRETIPPTNPTNINAWKTSSKNNELTSGNWSNAGSPHFEWSGASDDDSGVLDYYLYYGTDETADPETTSGIIEDDSSPYQTGQESFTLSSDMSSDTTYYLRIATRDLAGNVAEPETLFVLAYDNKAPEQVEYINVSPAGCSTSESFDFSWQEPIDNGASGISHYQYKLGSTGSLKTTSDTSISESSYQNLDNVFYLRAVDNAGNIGTWQTAVYCSIRETEIIDGPSVTSRPGSLEISWRSDKETSSFVRVRRGNQYVGQHGQSTLTKDHNVTIIGLEPSTQYTYRLVWTDENGNIGQSTWFTTQTQPPPQVANLNIEVLNQTSAVVSFDTTRETLAAIRYGQQGYSQEISMGSNFASNYSYRLNDLEPETTYQLSIRATIDSGFQFDSESHTFTTPPYPSISNLEVEQLTDRPSATIKASWTTNVNTSSVLTVTPTEPNQQAKKQRTISSAKLAQEHSLVIEGLVDQTEYILTASGRDQYGNETVSSPYSLTTPEDTRPPEIFDFKLETSTVGTGKDSKAQIIVSWQTDEPATSQVEYGIGVGGDSYQAKTAKNESYSMHHTVIISELDPARTYHLRALSMDAAGNLGQGEDNVIITGQAPQNVLDIIIDKLKETFGFLANIRELMGR